LTSKVERKIFDAFDAIHSLDVVHGDVRPENILVSDDGNAVWIVDFEFSEIVDGDEGKESKFSCENRAVKELLSDCNTTRAMIQHAL
jgi:serine/threonine protein kinase